MSAGTPYIGSKISLISKAEIRYQGTLYQVDTKEATVTLAKVRSFGTEDRSVSKAIPPRNETYEFIIFRGSDIKDLHVSEVPNTEQEASTPEDPAIVSATHSPRLPPSTASASQPSTVHSHPQPPPTYNPFPPPPNIYSPFGMPYMRPPIMMGARGAQQPPHPPIHPSHGHPAHAVPIHHAQHTGGPRVFNHSQVQPQQQTEGPPQGDTIPLLRSQVAVTEPRPLISTSYLFTSALTEAETSTLTTPTPAPASTEAGPQASSTPRVITAETTPKASLPLESESPGIQKTTRAQPPVPVGGQQIQPPPLGSVKEMTGDTHTQVDSTTQYEDRPVGSVGTKRSAENSQKFIRKDRNQNNAYSRQDDWRGGHRGYNRGGSRGYHRGPPRGSTNSTQYQRRPTRGASSASNDSVYRYDSDFDFESANARFNKEVFVEEFKQLQVDDKRETLSRRTSDTNEVEVEPSLVAEDNVQDLSEDLENEVESEEEEFYDKSKSFFDSISCDSSSHGSQHRPTRNTEREMNTETFGVGNVRGYNRRRGRGRGRGYGRGYYGGRGGNRYHRGNNRYGNGQEQEGSDNKDSNRYGNRREQGNSDSRGRNRYGNRREQGNSDNRDSNRYGNRREQGNSDNRDSNRYGNRREQGNSDTRGRYHYGNRREQGNSDTRDSNRYDNGREQESSDHSTK